MQKSLTARILAKDKKYFLSVKSKVIDGRIFITGKVDAPEEKLQITKIAWETKGARSVKNAISIKGQTNFKSTAKRLNTSALKVWATYFDKQVNSVFAHVNHANVKKAESIDSRFADIINFLG